MPRSKKHKRFTRFELGAHYWAIYDNHVHIGVVAAGSKANYYFANTAGVVIDEGFGSMKQALAACLTLRMNLPKLIPLVDGNRQITPVRR